MHDHKARAASWFEAAKHYCRSWRRSSSEINRAETLHPWMRTKRTLESHAARPCSRTARALVDLAADRDHWKVRTLAAEDRQRR